MVLILLLAALFDVLGLIRLQSLSQDTAFRNMEIVDEDFRAVFFSEDMCASISDYSSECQKAVHQVESEVKYFPVPQSALDSSLEVTFADSWMGERTYGGERGHEGTDLMASKDVSGLYPVLSMSDGTISNLGWLEKGGYRIGISTENGTYYYYAHLDSYADIEEGDTVKAGQLLGYMGDSGYGEEGTTGMFPVHLHIGIYFYTADMEVSVNPYYVLKYLENKKLKYQYA